MANNPIKIAIQGIEGSFSEEAALTFAQQQKIENPQFAYVINSENVLTALNQRICQFGIVALENSTGGVVFETIEALSHHPCRIIKYFSISIQQNLLALHSTFRGDITEIHSHNQALRQCRHYLKTHFAKTPLQEAPDTALSAKNLHEKLLPATAAVIANKRCATLFNLKIIAENINDLKDNQTLFMALGAAG